MVKFCEVSCQRLQNEYVISCGYHLVLNMIHWFSATLVITLVQFHDVESHLKRCLWTQNLATMSRVVHDETPAFEQIIQFNGLWTSSCHCLETLVTMFVFGFEINEFTFLNNKKYFISRNYPQMIINEDVHISYCVKQKKNLIDRP